MDESERKSAALLLWDLMATAEEDLGEFRRQRIGPTSQLGLEHLERLQSIMSSLAEALHVDDADRWKRVQLAWTALQAPSAPSETTAANGSAADDRTVLPFVKPDPASDPPRAAKIEAPDPEDPESETIRLRAHVMPFKNTPRPAPDSETRTVLVQRQGSKEAPSPPPSQPTRVTDQQESAPSIHESIIDEPTNVSSMAKTRERGTVPERAGPHGLPVLHDEDEDEDEHRPTQVKAVPVSMRVDRYALFCAECVVFGDGIAEIRAKHGVLSEAEHNQLDQSWRRRFAANHVLQQKWQILYDVNRTKLLARKGEG